MDVSIEVNTVYEISFRLNRGNLVEQLHHVERIEAGLESLLDAGSDARSPSRRRYPQAGSPQEFRGQKSVYILYAQHFCYYLSL